jgi:hypothetical protein
MQRSASEIASPMKAADTRLIQDYLGLSEKWKIASAAVDLSC